MTFRKNLFTLLTAVFLAVTGAWLMKIEVAELVSGLTLVIPTVILALLIEDLFRKLLGEREKLTWQYFLGEMFIIGSTLSWFWASTSITMKELIIRLVTTFLLAGIGMLWFNIVYRGSTQTIEEKQQAKWARLRTKIKASTKEEGYKILSGILRYRMDNNTLSGNIDFTSPLAPYDNQFMTYEEIMAEENDDGSGNLQMVRESASKYIQDLTRELE